VKPLTEYTRKRNFKITGEPVAKLRKKSKSKPLLFVVQEHHASHLHYDFRLEWDGVLKSWAVPKGPSLDPSQKRLAVEVEDHPYDYATFEGIIPADQYGGGEVYRWDMGTWSPHGDVDKGLRKGHLEFALKGKRLKGDFVLVRTSRPSSKPQWLLIKRNDDYAKPGDRLKMVREYGSTRENPDRGKKLKGVKVWQSSKASRGVKAAFPEFIPPQLAQLVDKPPDGDEWIHEIKFDGYRIQVQIRNGKVKMRTRKGLDWSAKYRSLASKLAELKVENAVVDGEVVWQDEKGRTDFQLLQNAMKAEKTEALIYWAFDLLYLNGKDLRSLSQLERKEILKSILPSDGAIRYSDHSIGNGREMLGAGCRMNLEGIVSKRADAAYVSGRHDYWVKSKCLKRQEFVIGGYTDPEGSRVAFGALLLGFYENGKFKFAGKCGTGFNQRTLRDVAQKMRKLEDDRSPFELNAPKGRGLHFVKPKLVAEISYAEVTRDGHLRVPVFQGLRLDKPAENVGLDRPKKVEEVKSEQEVDRSDVKVSHPDRIIYEKEGITKLDVAKYYDAVADWILPYISERPLALVRCTSSSTKPCFFSKHFTQHLPEYVLQIPEEGEEPWIAVDSRQGLRQLIQWGTLEIHPWNTHRDHLDEPDQIVMDFDPDPGIPFKVVKEGALELRDMLEQLGIKSFVKTTGGKGLHVQFPFEPLYEWEPVKEFAKTLVQEMAGRHPDLYTANMSKKARKGKIFLDYLRNGKGATAIAPYGLRARAVSAVAMPLAWEDLKKLKAADVFTMKKALAHLKRRKKDPWKDYFKLKQKIKLLN
jgi:bifunctional non-homologous end joining protein LigD